MNEKAAYVTIVEQRLPGIVIQRCTLAHVQYESGRCSCGAVLRQGRYTIGKADS